jgi:hypothetical protein
MVWLELQQGADGVRAAFSCVLVRLLLSSSEYVLPSSTAKNTSTWVTLESKTCT